MLPIVLIHGLIGSFADPRMLSALQPAAVLTPDLHGYGSSITDPITGLTIQHQADYVHDAIAAHFGRDARVHLVGHSVGGVVAADYIDRYPGQVATFVNVEGNFTLNDAFWSAKVATMSADEANQMMVRDQAEPARWLEDSGIEATPGRVQAATEALAFQPASTVQASARAVVEYTGHSGYEDLLRQVFATVPVHLVAGAYSRAGWDVPDWALDGAASYTEIPDVGHMMMLEEPILFGQELRQIIDVGRPQP